MATAPEDEELPPDEELPLEEELLLEEEPAPEEDPPPPDEPPPEQAPKENAMCSNSTADTGFTNLPFIPIPPNPEFSRGGARRPAFKRRNPAPIPHLQPCTLNRLPACRIQVKSVLWRFSHP